MKSSTKGWTVLTLVVALIFIWQGIQSSVRQEATGEKLASVPGKAPPVSGQSLNVAEAAPSTPKPSLSSQDTLPLIHLKLRQWIQVQAAGGDDNDHSLAELEALLANANAMDIIQSLSADELNTPFGLEVLGKWLQSDRAAATNWVAARLDAPEDLTAVVAQGWAGDAGALEKYLDQVPDGVWKQDFLLETSSLISSRDPLAAINLSQQMKPDSARADFLQTVAGDWISRDPEAARQWIASVDDPALRERLIAAGARSYALTDPSAAATWLVSSVKSPEIVKEAELSIVETWVGVDPAEAANWVAQLPAGDTRQSAVALVASHWLQTDPDAASGWRQNLPGAF